MNLFYTPDIEGEYYTLSPEESKHCVRVLRMEAGEPVVLVDGRGNWCEGVMPGEDCKDGGGLRASFVPVASGGCTDEKH